jgi:hypothetical protein
MIHRFMTLSPHLFTLLAPKVFDKRFQVLLQAGNRPLRITFFDAGENLLMVLKYASSFL